MSRREEQFDDKNIVEEFYEEQEMVVEDDVYNEEDDDHFYDFIDLIRTDISIYLDSHGIPIGQKLRTSDLVKLLNQLLN